MPLEGNKAEASPWLAPAPQHEMAAPWVEEVARKLQTPYVSNIFMNIPFGSPQSTILDLLNEAAIGLETDHPRYARDLVRQAVEVLDKTAGEGWYSEEEVRPIQAMILRHARQGFQEAGDKLKAHEYQHIGMGKRERMQQGGIFEPDTPYKPRPRYEDYTSEHWQSGYRPRTGDPTSDQSLRSQRRQDLIGSRVSDRERYARERDRDRGRFTEEDWRRHARQQGDSRSMREFDRNRDRNRFSQERFGDSRRMRNFDRSPDRAQFRQGGFEDERMYFDDRSFRGRNRQ